VFSRFGIPRPAMWFNLACPSSFCSSFALGKAAAVISVATIITYLVGPISVMVLRRTRASCTAAARAGCRCSRRSLRTRHADAFLARWPHTGQIMRC